MFFNEQGMLNLDEAVMNQPTFKKIMEDGIVTEPVSYTHLTLPTIA